MTYNIYADLRNGKGLQLQTNKPPREKADAEIERLLKSKTKASRAYAIPVRPGAAEDEKRGRRS